MPFPLPPHCRPSGPLPKGWMQISTLEQPLRTELSQTKVGSLIPAQGSTTLHFHSSPAPLFTAHQQGKGLFLHILVDTCHFLVFQ